MYLLFVVVVLESATNDISCSSVWKLCALYGRNTVFIPVFHMQLGDVYHDMGYGMGYQVSSSCASRLHVCSISVKVSSEHYEYSEGREHFA